MNGWTIPTTVFLVAAAILCAALLTIHYAPRAWRAVDRYIGRRCDEFETYLAEREAGR